MEIKNIKLSDLEIDDRCGTITSNDIRTAAIEIKENKNKPLLINWRYNKKTNYLVWGHKYVEAAKKLNIEELPSVTIKIDHFKEDELVKKINNKLFTWDFEELVSHYWFDRTVTPGEVYTEVRNTLLYEPNGGYIPKLEECVNLEEYNRALKDLEKMTWLSEEEKELGRLFATRFIQFNFSNIADRYVNVSPEVRKMYERMLVVIIDTDNAISNGFKKLIKGVFSHGYQGK